MKKLSRTKKITLVTMAGLGLTGALAIILISKPTKPGDYKDNCGSLGCWVDDTPPDPNNNVQFEKDCRANGGIPAYPGPQDVQVCRYDKKKHN